MRCENTCFVVPSYTGAVSGNRSRSSLVATSPSARSSVSSIYVPPLRDRYTHHRRLQLVRQNGLRASPQQETVRMLFARHLVHNYRPFPPPAPRTAPREPPSASRPAGRARLSPRVARDDEETGEEPGSRNTPRSACSQPARRSSPSPSPAAADDRPCSAPRTHVSATNTREGDNSRRTAAAACRPRHPAP